jgi:signal transduction histidine kinase
VPALRRPSPLLIDVTITVVVYVATVYPTLRHAPTDWWKVLFATMASVPLLWRRRAPVVVALVTGIGTSALSIEQALPDLPYGQLVATYTFAELSSALWRLVCVIGTAIGVVISLAVPEESIDSFGYVGIGFVTAYALGTGVRARRHRIDMLEERTRRLAEEQVAATARERSRIARDMHDVLAHSVGMMVVQAEGGASIVHADAGRAEAAFEAIAETGREALVQLRHTLGLLRDQQVDDAPNTDTTGIDGIERLVRRARSAGLNASLTVIGGAAMQPSPDVSVAAYRVVQEALTNTVKHAGAKAVAVRLTWDLDGTHTVTVTDDGRGATTNGSGHGLVGMRERVNACGGRLHTGPGRDGTGFQVRATLPAVR